MRFNLIISKTKESLSLPNVILHTKIIYWKIFFWGGGFFYFFRIFFFGLKTNRMAKLLFRVNNDKC